MNIGNRIKDVRKRAKITQEDFGAAVGIGGTSISKIESGERMPSNQTIQLIADRFGVNPGWLRTGAGEMYPEPTPEERLLADIEALPATKRLLVDIVKYMPVELMEQVIREIKYLRSKSEKD